MWILIGYLVHQSGKLYEVLVPRVRFGQKSRQNYYYIQQLHCKLVLRLWIFSTPIITDVPEYSSTFGGP